MIALRIEHLFELFYEARIKSECGKPDLKGNAQIKK